MELVEHLSKFYSAVRQDPRVGATHISLYMAIFQQYSLNDFRNPVCITRASLMSTAKIAGLATYHKCIKDLVTSGFIRYIPSFNPCKKSEVIVL